MELSSAIRLLGDILGDVIAELESRELFEVEERIRLAAKDRRGGKADAAKQLAADLEALNLDQARAVSAAFTTYFDLVNLAEEYSRVQQLREREAKQYPAPLGESVGNAVAALKKQLRKQPQSGNSTAETRSIFNLGPRQRYSFPIGIPMAYRFGQECWKSNIGRLNQANKQRNGK